MRSALSQAGPDDAGCGGQQDRQVRLEDRCVDGVEEGDGASPRLVDTLILDRGSRGSEFDPHGYE
ncbi:hypothetical protein, partial [Promicromonospora xylanilytica]